MSAEERAQLERLQVPSLCLQPSPTRCTDLISGPCVWAPVCATVFDCICVCPCHPTPCFPPTCSLLSRVSPSLQLVRVSPRFRVIALGLPVPQFPGVVPMHAALRQPRGRAMGGGC